MKLFVFFIILSLTHSYNHFSIYEYFIHDDKIHLNHTQKLDEIKFYREIEKASVQKTLLSAGVTCIVGIPMVMSGVGLIPLSIPLIISSYSVTNGIVAFLSKENKNEMRYRASKDYKLCQESIPNIINDHKRLSKHSKYAFYINLFITSAFFFFISYTDSKFMWKIILFVVYCFISSYLLTMYVEYRKSLTDGQIIVQKWCSECNYYIKPTGDKIWFRVTGGSYDKESGYLRNNKQCNEYISRRNEISKTAIEILALTGLKSTVRSFQYVYWELEWWEMIFWVVFLFISILLIWFVSIIVNKSKNNQIYTQINQFIPYTYEQNDKLQ